MTKEQELLYHAANRLSHDALTKFLIDNHLDEEEYMTYRKHQLTRPTIKSVSKQVKAKLLKEQGGCCGFCRDPIPHGVVACYNQDKGDVLCRRCTMALINFKSVLRAGITWDLIKERIGDNYV